MIDENKQPGVKFDAIILTKEEFWRLPKLPETIGLDLNMNSNISNSEENASNELNTVLIGRAEDGNEVFKLDITFVGFFSTIQGQENMNLITFMNTNSAALMFSYIREHVSSITMKSGMQPIILSPINVQALVNSSKGKTC